MKYFLYDIFFREVHQFTESNSFLNFSLHMSGELLIFKVVDRPKTKVHCVEHKQLKECSLWILLSLVEGIRVEGPIRKAICNGRQLMLVNNHVFCLIGNPLTGGPNELALIAHISYNYKIIQNQTMKLEIKNQQAISLVENQRYPTYEIQLTFLCVLGFNTVWEKLKLLMNIKRSEEFIYFQDKARHYHNLRQARPAVVTYRRSAHSTLDEYNRVPYFQRYDMQRDNEGLINRITNIMSSSHCQVQKHGYTRYNNPFQPRSHLTIEQRKSKERIHEGNHHLARDLLNTKPSIGTIQNWNHHFQQNQQRRKNISKFTQHRVSKGSFDLYASSSFIPQHYRSFLGRSLNKEAPSGESPEDLPLKIKIRVEKLLQLPKLKRLRGSLTRIGLNEQPQ